MRKIGIGLKAFAFITGFIFITAPIGLGLRELIFETTVWWAKWDFSIIIGLILFVPSYLIGDWLMRHKKASPEA